MNFAKMTSTFEQSKSLAAQNAANEPPNLQQLVEKRDFVGALTLLQFWKTTGTAPEGTNADLWLAYCYFHNAEYELAEKIYTDLQKQEPPPLDINMLQLYKAISQLYQGKMDEARQLAQKLPSSPLQNRLLFHAASRLLDEDSVQLYHTKLKNVTPDQLALAAVHYLRTHYNQALECYEEVLSVQNEYYAINMHMAMCFYRLGEFQRCEEQLEEYRQHAEDSFTSLNLLAATKFKLGKSREAAEILDQMKNDDIISQLPAYKHNRCLYDNMHAATHVLQTLQSIVPEARQNLLKLFIEQKDYERAYKTMQTLEPAVSLEYTLKAAAFAFYGQHFSDMDALAYARAAYATVGQSEADKDTLLGRRAMAAAYFLDGEYDDAAVYFDSIAEIPKECEEAFDLNYGMALAAIAKDDQALEFLARHVKSQFFTLIHKQWLARLFIRAKKAKLAFELYDSAEGVSENQIQLLRVIGHECFAVGEFKLCAEAAKILLRIDSAGEKLQEYKTMFRAGMAGAMLKERGKKVTIPKMVQEDDEEYETA